MVALPMVALEHLALIRAMEFPGCLLHAVASIFSAQREQWRGGMLSYTGRSWLCCLVASLYCSPDAHSKSFQRPRSVELKLSSPRVKCPAALPQPATATAGRKAAHQEQSISMRLVTAAKTPSSNSGVVALDVMHIPFEQ